MRGRSSEHQVAGTLGRRDDLAHRDLVEAAGDRVGTEREQGQPGPGGQCGAQGARPQPAAGRRQRVPPDAVDVLVAQGAGQSGPPRVEVEQHDGTGPGGDLGEARRERAGAGAARAGDDAHDPALCATSVDRVPEQLDQPGLAGRQLHHVARAHGEGSPEDRVGRGGDGEHVHVLVACGSVGCELLDEVAPDQHEGGGRPGAQRTARVVRHVEGDARGGGQAQHVTEQPLVSGHEQDGQREVLDAAVAAGGGGRVHGVDGAWREVRRAASPCVLWTATRLAPVGTEPGRRRARGRGRPPVGGMTGGRGGRDSGGARPLDQRLGGCRWDLGGSSCPRRGADSGNRW